MAQVKKQSLQTYVYPVKKAAYLELCDARGVSASREISDFIDGQLKKYNKGVK